MAKARTQKDYRRDFNAPDQYGRLWLATIEIATGDPTGMIEPAGWIDPLHTPQKYLTIRNAMAFAHSGAPVHVDLDRWARDQQVHDEEWKRSFFAIGQKVYQNRFDAKDELRKIGTPDEDEYLMSLAGPRPWPSVEVLLKARAGHRKLLGLDPLDRETRKLLGQETLDDLEAGLVASAAGTLSPGAVPDTGQDTASTAPPSESYQEFVSRVMKAGEAKTMKEAAALWNAAKAR